jgi:NADH-ubiquinone oxidoreductase chain 2
MLVLATISILLSNSVSLKRDLSIIFNRIAIIGLAYCILQTFAGFFILNKGIGLHGGLLYITNITQIFYIFIFLISIFILFLTSFHPRKI